MDSFSITDQLFNKNIIKVKRVLVYGQTLKDSHMKYLKVLLQKLKKEGIEVYFFTPFSQYLKKEFGFDEVHKYLSTTDELLRNDIDFLISIGGDGTILNSAVLVHDSNTPIIGINLGRLGFLAIVEKNIITEAIDNIINGNYLLQQRSLLNLVSEPELFNGDSFALNDFTMHKSASSSVIVVHTYLNGVFLNTYWADGLIVSTPTGSTGYSLSCGGPIVFPGSGNFVITPVAPHNLTMRPIVVPDDSELLFEVETRSDSFLVTLDSRYETITQKHKLIIKKANFKINLIIFEGYEFSKSIRNKLNWGNDKRN